MTDTTPWLPLYDERQPAEIAAEYPNLRAMWAASVERAPDQAAIRYFDGVLTVAELDAASDALTAGLQDLGFGVGDRIVLFLQNNPAFVIGMLAAWKAGGIAVAANPMYKNRELGHLVRDSGATMLLCLDELHEVAAGAVAGSDVRTVITCSARDHQTRNDDRVITTDARRPVEGAVDLLDLLRDFDGATPKPTPEPDPDDVCFLVYTSGTTGDPKGAELTHGNFVFNARSYREWMDLQPDEPILAIAPLFHITGLVGHGIVSLLVPSPLVLGHRFHGPVMLDLVREHKPVFTVGAITAFTALAAAPGRTPEDFTSLTKLYSGGAPIAPTIADGIERDLGQYVHNAYGLTETSSITHLVPPSRRAPVDPVSGALSIGVPISSTHVRVVGEDGAELPPGEIGELEIAGPQVARGYWGRPDATRDAFPGGALRTGDVGFRDAGGWFYLVDRKKDMIIASGYKVWPREVEDVLYSHPAVREAAVVGVPDQYRGETVHAFVSLRPGSVVTPEELIAHCKDQLAAYKYPRQVMIVDELPKTASGKILRRELRGG